MDQEPLPPLDPALLDKLTRGGTGGCIVYRPFPFDDDQDDAEAVGTDVVAGVET
jgi:hypothetical protein